MEGGGGYCLEIGDRTCIEVIKGDRTSYKVIKGEQGKECLGNKCNSREAEKEVLCVC